MKLLKFHASWCKPCKDLSNTMSKVTHNTAIEEIDIEQDSKAARTYAVRGIPTLVLIDENGGIIRRHSGIMTEEQFKQFIEG